MGALLPLLDLNVMDLSFHSSESFTVESNTPIRGHACEGRIQSACVRLMCTDRQLISIARSIFNLHVFIKSLYRREFDGIQVLPIYSCTCIE